MNMKFWYEKSISGLQKYFKIYKRIPGIEEWNKYAYENNYLSSESIRYISGLKFQRWCRKIKGQFRQNEYSNINNLP